MQGGGSVGLRTSELLNGGRVGGRRTVYRGGRLGANGLRRREEEDGRIEDETENE